MKNTILIILALLPIVLLVVIAFAGRIIVFLQHTPVEDVVFVDRLGNVYEDGFDFTVEQGKSKPTIVNVLPKIANNQSVTYSSADESICTVDANGVITGVHWGSTTVTVRTDDGGKKAVLNVLVKADTPFAVTLSKHELAMKIGESQTLNCEVDAPVAVRKDVTYTSSNPDVVTINKNGKVVARSLGTATITVTTVLGEKTDTCVVTVEEGKLPIYFDFDGNANINKNTSDVYVTTESVIDLKAVLKTDEGINPADVQIRILSGAMHAGEVRATLEDGVLTLHKEGIVVIEAYVGDPENPTNRIEYKFGLQTGN